MNIVVVSGSSRPNNQSHKIATWTERKLQALGATTTLIDLQKITLPLDVDLDVDDIAVTPRAAEAWEPIANTIANADGFLIVSPEWNGMAPPALMNFFIYASSVKVQPLAHKPFQLFTVSSTRGGDYPIAQLKVFGPKNTKAVYIPGAMAIRYCKDVFNADTPADGNDQDQYLQKRANYSLQLLLDYAQAFKTLRHSTKLDLHEYWSGM